MSEAEAQLRFGLPLPDWLPTPGLRRQKRGVAALKAILQEIIHEHQRQLAQGDNPADLLAMLLTARDEAGQPLSEEQILDECLTIFVAGHETTAVALTWAWVLLLKHPAVLAKLTDEVDTAIGNTPVTYDALSQMPFLTQVVKEVLRYYPPAPGFGRTPLETITVNGHTFKPGDTIIVSIYTLHHQADFYPDPERFRPERFADDAEQPSRYAYIPFGAGPRTCIGNAFAMLELQVVLATMVQSLRLALAPDQTIVPETLVTLRPKDGVQVRVEELHSIDRGASPKTG
jgi:cytochrome P450